MRGWLWLWRTKHPGWGKSMRFGLKSRLMHLNYTHSKLKINMSRLNLNNKVLHKYGVGDLVGVNIVEDTG